MKNYLLVTILLISSLFTNVFLMLQAKKLFPEQRLDGYVVMMPNTTTDGYGRVGVQSTFSTLKNCYKYKETLIAPDNKICVNIHNIQEYIDLHL